MSLTDIFCSLVEIPSPSMHEEKVAEKIISLLKGFGAEARLDQYGNVIAFVKATDLSKKPLMLSGHMDVVGDFSSVVVRKSADGVFFETDKKRTLGADDKAGIACALFLTKELCQKTDLKHGGLELVFTRDEEVGMSGARAVDFSDFKSEHVLVLDAEKIGEIQVSGAGYTKMSLSVTGTKGGHSGLNISDASRVNAVKILAEAISLIPQGVYRKDEKGIVTSINIGAVAGGGLKNIATDLSGASFSAFLAENAFTNVINTEAYAVYSIRSSSQEVEKELKQEIERIIADLNVKYENKAVFSVDFVEHVKPFEACEDEKMLNVLKKAFEKSGFSAKISSFHAAAETHVYAYCHNANGKKMKPYLLGVANIHNMHSADEKVEIASMQKGYALIKNIFETFNEEA